MSVLFCKFKVDLAMLRETPGLHTHVVEGLTWSYALSLSFFLVRRCGQVVAHRPDIVITRAPLHDDLTAPAECLYTSAPEIMWENNLHSDIVSPPVSPSASPLASDASCQLKLTGELQTVSSSITSDTSGSHLSLAVMSKTPHDGERLGVPGGLPTYKSSPASRGSSCRLWHSELWSHELCSPHHCSRFRKSWVKGYKCAFWKRTECNK